MGTSSQVQYWKKAMNEGLLKSAEKVVNAVKKVDNPKLKINAPKPLEKFKRFIKSRSKYL